MTKITPGKMTVKKFENAYLTNVLEIFRSNVPEYFYAHEEQDLINFLGVNEYSKYFDILFNEENIAVAAAGFTLSNEEIFPPPVKPEFLENKNFETYALFCWGMVHKDFQGKGFGKLLANHRIERIRAIDPKALISLRTSQITSGFYEKTGFKIGYTQKAYWGENFDLMQMYLLP